MSTPAEDTYFVLVAYHPGLAATWVVEEDMFIEMMRKDTDDFYPHIPRSHVNINGEDFNGYRWFNKHLLRVAKRNHSHIPHFFGAITANFSNYEWELDTAPGYEGYDSSDLNGPVFYSVVRAGDLHPDLLVDLTIRSLDGSPPTRPWEPKQSGEGPQGKLLYAEDKGIYKDADQPATRPMWLL